MCGATLTSKLGKLFWIEDSYIHLSTLLIIHSILHISSSVHIAQYKEYTKPLIDHLLARKVTHWDTAIRELAAKALGNLTFRDPRYMVETVLPNLLDMLSSIDLNIRHGSVLAVAEILESLHANSDEKIDNIIGRQTKLLS